MTDDDLRFELGEWAIWMGGYNPNIGFPSRVPIISGGGGSPTFEELLEHSDAVKMKAIDASVDSLAPAQKAAIHRRYGICGVWRFPRDNYQQMLDAAHDALHITMRRKGY